MESFFIYQENHIYLFDSINGNSVLLKNIIHFLKWKTLKQIVKFDHVPEQGNLLETLSLHDNITLELKEFCRYRKIPKNMKDYFVKNIGESAIPLVEHIPNWDCSPADVTPRVCKIVSLLRALNNPNQYLILQRPEEFLNSKQIEVFKVLFNDLVAKRNTELILFDSPSNGIWSDLFTKRISHEKNLVFKVEDFNNNILHLASKQDQKEIQVATSGQGFTEDEQETSEICETQVDKDTNTAA